MKNTTAAFFILVSLVIMGLSVPVVSAAVPGNNQQTGPIYTTPELNLTGVNTTNQTLPEKYMITPTLIRIEVRISDTMLPAAKGEMVVGPRSIGFSTDPVSLAIAIIVAAMLGAGMWYIIKRKPAGKNEDGSSCVISLQRE